MKEVNPNRPFDIDPYDAEGAVSDGDAVCLKIFLEETSGTLIELSQMISETGLEGMRKSRPRINEHITNMEEEWVGSTSQVRLAISCGDVEHPSEYLLQLSRVVHRLGVLVDPDRRASEKHIAKIGIRKMGRPKKDRTKGMFERSLLELKTRFSLLRTKKKEASIQEVVDEGVPSRATQFRKLRPSKKA